MRDTTSVAFERYFHGCTSTDPSTRACLANGSASAQATPRILEYGLCTYLHV